MQTDDWCPPPFSHDALHVFGLLARRGGCMRIGPLLAASAMRPEALADAVNELAERSWVKITWRTTRPHPPADLPDRFHPVERVTTTGFGKWRYPVTWPY